MGLFAILAIAWWRVAAWYARRMTDGSDEPWGLLALAAAATCIWRGRASIRIARSGAAIAVALTAAQLVAGDALPALVRAAMGTAALAALLGISRRLPAVTLLLALSLPLVASLDFYLGYPLQLVTAIGSWSLVRLAMLDVSREGLALLWQGQPVMVDAACSGVRMLWWGLFLHAGFSAWLNAGWRSILRTLPLAFSAVVLGNVVRATLLFFKESGIIPLPPWTHEGVGLAVFAAVAWMLRETMLRCATPRRSWSARTSLAASAALLAAMVIAVGSASWLESRAAATGAGFPGWPATFEGEPLTPLPLDETEQRFATGFPGRIGSFACGDRRILLRWVAAPTRKLHSSADCLRALGYKIIREPLWRDADGAQWSRFFATRDSGTWLARERLWSSDGGAWTGISAWFWEASLDSSRGPWWAVTVLEPAPLHLADS